MKKTNYDWLTDTLELIIKGKLDAHKEMATKEADALVGICNGCGAANAKFDFVPKTLWGLNITPACMIHDFDYSKGRDIWAKEEADRRFMNNMLRLIEAKKGILKPLRRRRALKYYEAVNRFGGPAYWAGKNG